ncbi:MAG: acyl carrier protein [Wenzhouxiangella sp.]
MNQIGTILERIESAVREIVAMHLNIGAGQVDGKSRLVEDLGADSLDMVEMILDAEARLGLRILDAEADSLTTVNDFVHYLGRARG